MLKVNYITIKSEKEIEGRSRYEGEIRKRLKNVKLNMIEYSPSRIKIKGISSILGTLNKILWFSLKVKRRAKKDSINHIIFEDLAFLLNFIKLEKTIINCHDLSRWVFYKKSLFWRFNIKGLKKADRIITVSNFSKNEIVKHLGYPKDKISVITDAVDHNLYYQKRDKAILKKYGISENGKIILFVGSEQQKQNLPFLIKSFSELKKLLPEPKLLKIGSPQETGARKKLLDLIKKLYLEKDVIFLGYVEEKELPLWYNAADLFVYPCLYAGFGLPPLEAMACGTPVITSNLTSLPEVVGDAGITLDPQNQVELTKAMYEVLTNETLRQRMVLTGLERAKTFSWERAATETLKVYNEQNAQYIETLFRYEKVATDK